ncbi:MAG: RluA family pseudouridine synthase [Pirellulaceae bacterium]
MDHPPFQILLEDNHLLAVVKPAELPTMGVDPQQPSLFSIARHYIKQKYRKPGQVYLGIVSRLDAPVTGAILLARTSKAARRLTEQFRTREVQKTYWALVPAVPDPDCGTLYDWLRKEERLQKMVICGEHAPGAVRAELSYRTLRSVAGGVLLEITLLTGRKHQIRVQLAARHLPVMGDRKYGSRLAFEPGIALHARRLRLVHPVRRTPLDIVAPLPASWRRFVPRSVED